MLRACRRLLCPSLTALSLCLLLGVAHAEGPLFSAEGYRISLYRSPTPDQAPGASIIDTAGLQTLLGQTPRPLLIDVYRRQWLHERFIEDQPHENLPGSHWLANTGDGDLTPAWQAYFARNLQTLTVSFTFVLPLIYAIKHRCKNSNRFRIKSLNSLPNTVV